MYRWSCAVAIALSLSFAGPAFAIVQDTSVTATKPAETGTVSLTLTQKDGSRTVRTTTINVNRTDRTARRTFRIDPEVTKTVIVTVKTDKGEREVIVPVADFVRGGPIDLGEGISISNPPLTAGSGAPAGGPAVTERPVVRTGTGGSPATNGAMPNGLYIAISGNSTDNETIFRPRDYVSAGAGDVKVDTNASARKSNFTPGFIMGFMMPNFGFLRTALEIEYNRLNSEVEMQGLAGLVGFPTAANDVLRFRKEWMLTMSTLLFMPSSVPNEYLRNFYAKVGFALLKEQMEYDCRATGFCGAAPAAAPFTAAQSHIATGLLLGIGYQLELAFLRTAYARIFARLGYDHIFVYGGDFQAGAPATRFVSGLVTNDIDRFYITLALTFGGGGLDAQ